jgi:acyl-CoA thioester hydrolase
MSDEIPAPLCLYRDVVREEWIDYNGHMNMGYYLVVFDLATDEFLDFLGLDSAHRTEHRVTTFSLEAHTCYLRELRSGDPLRFETQLLDFDEKRIHYVHGMYHAQEGYLAATNELMSLHVSQQTRRAAPMAPAVLERLARVREAHARLGPPPQAGRRIGMQRPGTPASPDSESGYL